MSVSVINYAQIQECKLSFAVRLMKSTETIYIILYISIVRIIICGCF